MLVRCDIIRFVVLCVYVERCMLHVSSFFQQKIKSDSLVVSSVLFYNLFSLPFKLVITLENTIVTLPV